jgi:hypothetical protein
LTWPSWRWITLSVIVRNPQSPADPGKRLLLIGRTDGGRAITLVIERTADPTSWLIVTGSAIRGQAPTHSPGTSTVISPSSTHATSNAEMEIPTASW